MSSISTIQHLHLSALAYGDFHEAAKGRSLGYVLDKTLYSKLKMESADLSPLLDPSNSLRSWILLDQAKPAPPHAVTEFGNANDHYSDANFSAIALQNTETGEIVFAFRGSDGVGDWLGADLKIAAFIPSCLNGQFHDAANFVFETLNKYGPKCYENQDAMFRELNQNSNVSFTGHSLGGGLAQYMTYKTADMNNNDIGVKSVTFNAVGVGQNTWDIEIWKSGHRYNSEDHVNSGDMVGNYGMQLGNTIHHAPQNSIDYEKVDFDLLAKLLINRYQTVKGNENNLDYVALISKSSKETQMVYNGYIGKSGELRALKHHSLDSFFQSDGEMTKAVSLVPGEGLDKYLKALSQFHNFSNAIAVIETAKAEGNYVEQAYFIRGTSLVKDFNGVSFYRNYKHSLEGNSIIPDKYSYTKEQIMHANFLVKRFERTLSNSYLGAIHSSYESATAAPPVDPLILDLNGDGQYTISLERSSTYFDLDSSGFAERAAWIDPNDGLLVLDRNEDGMINNGQELFGDQTVLINGNRATSGFEALAEFDINKDGKIDAKDVVYAKLKIWQDMNSDGVSQAEELKSLADMNVAVINLSSSTVNTTDAMGNIQRRSGSFTLTDGGRGHIAEYLLNRDTLDSRDLLGEGVTVPDDILALPNVQGAGNVTSLHVAMAKDESGELKRLLADVIAPENAPQRQVLFTNMLYKWVGAEGIDPKSRGDLIDARQLAVLEKFMGTSFVGTNGANPNVNAAPLLRRAYDKLFNRLYASVAGDTFLKELLEKIEYTVDESGVVMDFSKLQAEIDAQLAVSADAGKYVLSDVVRVLHGYELEKLDASAAFIDHFATKSSDLAAVVYRLRDGAVVGNDNANSLSGAAESDAIIGDAGNDALYGQAGDDTLVGGTGNDRLEGSEGNDTYLFSKGDGVDTIVDMKGVDTIQFTEDITPDDITVRLVNLRENEISLEIAIKDTEDKIIVDRHAGRRYYNSPHMATPEYQIERIAFADGTVWDSAEITRRAHSIIGTDKSESWSALDDGTFTYRGLAGDDYINGGRADDHLYGDEGNDYLRGGSGNDILAGGSGSDSLYGEFGDDIYVFNRGDGVDKIYENSGFDTIQFGDDVKVDDVVARVININNVLSLELSIKGTDDKLIVEKHYGHHSYYGSDSPDPSSQVEQVMFADGTVWSLDDIYYQTHNVTGAEGNDTLRAVGTTDFVLRGNGGDDALHGSRGSDTLYGGDGNDQLHGDSGDDTYVGGRGDDIMHDYRGNDVYIFNKGDGKDVINDYDGVNILRFGEGISPQDITVERTVKYNDYNLDLKHKNTEDSVTVTGYFGDYSNWSGSTHVKGRRMDRIEFADGTVWTPDVVYEMVHNRIGTEGDDSISAYDDGAVTYYGLGGNDRLSGSKGSDKLYGGDGNDTLNGGEGDDLFVGGRGDDVIGSYRGDDTYVFNRGDGADRISDYGGVDKLKLGEGISPSDVVVRRFMANYDAHLELSFKDSADRIIVERHFGSGSYNGFRETDQYKIDEIAFADGTVWTLRTLHAILHNQTGTDGNDTMTIYDDHDTVFSGMGGDDILYGRGGNDTLLGGLGNDRLSGGGGDDTYVFNLGDGQDVIDENGGTDTVIFGPGIHPNNIAVNRVVRNYSAHLTLSIKGTDDVLTIERYFGDGGYNGMSVSPRSWVEKFVFADGTEWGMETIHQKMHNVVGTDGNDSMHAYDDDPVMFRGMDGNDTLSGRKADDMLYGGGGNDYLVGGAGDDTYVFRAGDGQDTIYDYGSIGDEARFGYASDSLIFERTNRDLRVRAYNAKDTVTVSDWYYNDRNKIETFTDVNGRVMTHLQVESLIQAMASFQKDTGLSWEQALAERPGQARSIIQEYWTAPTA